MFLLIDALRAAGFGTKEGVRTLEHEIRTKIFRAHLVIGCKSFRSSALKDGSFIQEIGSVDDGEGFAHIVVGDYDTDVLILELGDDVLDIFHRNRVDSGKRLVKKDELRVNGKSAGDLATTTLTS